MKGTITSFQISKVVVAQKLLEAKRLLQDVRSSAHFDHEDVRLLDISAEYIARAFEKVIPQ